MMKFVMSLVFMIPLRFYVNDWLILLLLLLLSFMVLINISFSSLLTNLSYFCGMALLSFTYSLFLFLYLTLLLSLLLVFSSLNFFIFYLFFEISLIPTLFLITGWGYQPKRVTAGVYLLFYTLLVSLLMMIALFYLYNKCSSLEFYFFNSINNLMLYYCVDFYIFS